MTITFEPLSNADVDITTSGALRLTGLALAYALLDDEANASGALSLTGSAYATQEGAPPVIVPPTTAFGSVYLPGEALASFDVHTDAEASDQLTLPGSAFASALNDANTVDAFATGGLSLIGYSLEEPEFSAWAFLVERRPTVSALANVSFATVVTNVHLSTAPAADYSLAITEVVRLMDSPQVFASFVRTVQDNLVLRDFVSVVFERQVLSDITLDDFPTAAARAIMLVTEQLVLADFGTSLLSTLHTVVSALALRDSVRMVMQGEVPASLGLADEIDARLTAIITTVADMMLADEIDAHLTLFTTIEAGFDIGDTTTLSLSALVEALASLELGVRVRVGDEMFVGYAMNLRSGAVTEYDNFPFNSMAVIGGKPYGAAPDGIYRLEGDDDAGTPIDASVRTGAIAFDQLSRAPYARMVFTADGQLLFRTITMDGGRRKETTYRMERRPLGTAVETRVDMAKGTTGTVWAFELVNEDGAYFEADALQVWVVPLTRRYSGR